MVGWNHRLNGHEFEQASGVGAGQGGLMCCTPWGHKKSNTTERLNNSNFICNISHKILLATGFNPSSAEGIALSVITLKL